MQLSKPTRCNTTETKNNNKAPYNIQLKKIAASTLICILTSKMLTHPKYLKLIYSER